MMNKVKSVASRGARLQQHSVNLTGGYTVELKLETIFQISLESHEIETFKRVTNLYVAKLRFYTLQNRETEGLQVFRLFLVDGRGRGWRRGERSEKWKTKTENRGGIVEEVSESNDGDHDERTQLTGRRQLMRPTHDVNVRRNCGVGAQQGRREKVFIYSSLSVLHLYRPPLAKCTNKWFIQQGSF